MFNRGSVRVLGLLVILGTGAAAGAQPVPRAVPGNDNFANAMELVLGSTVKISDPSAATEEILSSEPDACGHNTYNSVWFTYTPVSSGWLYLSTSGTQLIDPLQSAPHTVLAVYTGSFLASLTPIVCNDDATGYQSEVTVPVVAGPTYYVQLTTRRGDITYAPESFYKLTSRLSFLYLFPRNSDFESTLTADNWTVKNGSGDGIICGDLNYTPQAGNCTFKFVGSAGEASKLVQTVNIPAGFKLRKKGMIFLKFWYLGTDAATIGNAKITATLTYANGTPSHKMVFNLSGQPAPGNYVFASGLVPLAHWSLSKIKLQVSHKSTVGVLLIDSFSLYYTSGIPIRDALPIPLPPL